MPKQILEWPLAFVTQLSILRCVTWFCAKLGSRTG